MAEHSSIEWTDASWNPVTGCSKVSPGCAHCYAETLSHRWRWTSKPWTPEHAAENVVLHPERLERPLHWRRPRRVFVNSMSDLWHEQVPDTFIAHVFETMRRAPQHVFQVLTKRPERALDWFERYGAAFERFSDSSWPLPNVWVGVSIENSRYTWRADLLREVPAAVRFISAEPLLGTLLDLETSSRGVLTDGSGVSVGARAPIVEAAESSALAASADGPLSVQVGPRTSRARLDLTDIDWLIVGGESGLRHRPLNLAWVRELRDACHVSGTAFFVKQLGGHRPGSRLEDLPADLRIREWPSVEKAA